MSVTEEFERALGIIRTRVSLGAGRSRTDLYATADKPSESFGQAEHSLSMAVAYSGGLDSSALLHLAHDYAAAHRIKLFAFHVHHGISANADAWLAHCERQCRELGIAFDADRISLKDRDRSGLEEAARVGRYATLGALCRKHKVPLLLTAHQQDDQAETVLLQLLRGSGVAGISGMDLLNTAPELLGDPDLLMGRPLLAVTRGDLQAFIVERGIAFIEDESNADPRYARNALRRHVMPELDRYFPGFQQRLARSARHAQAAQRLLDQLAAQDLVACVDGKSILVDRLKRLDADRMDNLLRHWLDLHGSRMPSTAWLTEMRVQLLNAREDARIRITHADCEIRRHRNRIFLTPRSFAEVSTPAPVMFRWNGEARLHFEDFGGTLHVESAAGGVDPDWLRGEDMVIRLRQGGERLKLAANRPTRSLKQHYQALNVPAWERERLPLVVTASDDLLFAAGIGMNWSANQKRAEQGIHFIWTSTSS